ncbi:hypothetical protein QW131_26740 [Roseibium salinum]|nr:hypothetical protein [Roseibium salinum]
MRNFTTFDLRRRYAYAHRSTETYLYGLLDSCPCQLFFCIPLPATHFLATVDPNYCLCVSYALGDLLLFLPDIRAWNLIISLLISVVASAVFALVSALFISYFFEDPTAAESKAVLLPQDIGPTLQNMANNAHDYKNLCANGSAFPIRNTSTYSKKQQEESVDL